MSELEKPFFKETDKKMKKKKQKINVKMPHVIKNHWREREIWFKQNTRPRMNYEWIVTSISEFHRFLTTLK